MKKRLVLAGAGHAHVQVLKSWARRPLVGVELLVVTPEPLSPYSGMVPGWLAGLYTFEEICIDVPALAREAGATLCLDRIAALDADARCITLESGDTLGYDVLSLDVGSTLRPPSAPPGAAVLGMRPLGALHAGWEALLHALHVDDGDRRPIELVVAGGGAAGFESALAAIVRLRSLRPDRDVRTRLYTASETLLPNLGLRARKFADAALVAAGVEVRAATALGDAIDATPIPPCDALLWATGGRAHAWQQASGLAVDRDGFVLIDDRLRSTSHSSVLAAGDCAAWRTPVPKAGVHAVHMGPVLSANVRAALGPGEPRVHTPKTRALALLSTADRNAIGSWGDLAFMGSLAWLWKDRIDRSFIRRFSASP